MSILIRIRFEDSHINKDCLKIYTETKEEEDKSTIERCYYETTHVCVVPWSLGGVIELEDGMGWDS